MRQWFLLNRVSRPPVDDWQGGLLGENGCKAVETFRAQRDDTGVSTLWLFKLDPWRGRPDLFLWWDSSRRPLASDVFGQLATMVGDLCSQYKVVCPAGWIRPEHWGEAFMDYEEWLRRVRSGTAQPDKQ